MSRQNLPLYLSPCYSKQDIQSAISVLAKSINDWANSISDAHNQDVVAVPVLRGGVFFFSDLVRELAVSVEMSPARAKAYVIGSNATMEKEVSVQFDEKTIRGRAVLLLDEICDSGATLKRLSESMQEAGALEVKSAVLIHRRTPETVFHPDWVGFEYQGSEWFVGYGMEDQNRWSNLPEIYTIKK